MSRTPSTRTPPAPTPWSPWTHVRAESIRDDCIENEGSSGTSQLPGSLVITRSLFDGCFTAFAERPSGASTAQNGTGASTFTLTDSLVYVQPQPLGPNYCSPTHVSQGRCRTTGTPDVWLGSYGIWKWSTAAAATVVVRDTVFRLDMPSYSSCSSQKWPAGTYQNVTLVWTGSQPYASAGGCANVLPPGVTLTTDVSVWDNAKAAWTAGTATPSTPATPTATPTVTPTVTPTGTPDRDRHRGTHRDADRHPDRHAYGQTHGKATEAAADLPHQVDGRRQALEVPALEVPRLLNEPRREHRETLVREGGVEPPRPFGHTDLNRARLPIPPLAPEAC